MQTECGPGESIYMQTQENESEKQQNEFNSQTPFSKGAKDFVMDTEKTKILQQN